MATLTRFEKEQALRRAGVLLAPYPTVGAATDRETQQLSDWALLDAGTAWEAEIDRLYSELVLKLEADSGPA
ncbi:hypothetical protein QMO14_32155 [Variovorax sp. CAN2819]|uniref:hypothetical protein n=1 Tax=Variovorax sp. CAN15 TaxID=3046727 RepID=UPI0026474272|nr:hypothetical protein [Variovorax sp. CAN15]MDN6888233.1 hypothetical protein [Variovorax sp. CAN15]